MPQDIVKTKGALPSNNPAVGGGVTNNFPVYGIVKDNIDPTRSGRIKVLIGDKSPQDSDSSDSWLTVGFMSNFFGTIVGSGGKDDNGTYKSNPSSYGEWHAPPDIGTKVICIFVNGDPNYGYYIGCVPEPEALHMVPAIGSSDNVQLNDGESTSYGGATRLPVTNFNSNNTALNDSGAFNDSPRPVHSYTASIMNQQGIIRDPIRGPISSSASRETASRVGWGVSTPGRPIYEGGFDDQTIASNLEPAGGLETATRLKVVARRGGHSLVMDDGDIIGRDQLIRIRTALGHQILMSDDGQTLMILHSNGQSYIELGKEGTVDIFSTNSFNVRTQGDINFHADRNINLHAMENLNIQAKNIQTNSEEKTTIRSGGDINMSATGKITGLAAGAIAWGAGGDASLVGGGQAFVNGSKVNLNSGAPGTSPDAVSPIPLVAQTDTLYDPEKGFMAAPGKLLTIASRAPAHAPWANAGQGVDVKTSMDAAANLPAPAPAATEAANQAAQATNPQPPATATVASAPSATSPVSAAIGKNTTAAAVAQSATAAASGPLAAATKQGTAIINTAQGKVAAVGAMAQTPAQLELGGALKPGAATIVNTLVQAGKSIGQALPKSLFSGSVPGATSLTSLVTNVTAQATTVVNTMQKAQSALGAVGALTGKEAPTQIAGMVTAAASVGVGPVVDVVKTAAAAAGATTSGPGTAGVTNAISAISGAASSISGTVSSVTGALNSVAGTSSLTGNVNKIAGAATGAINTAKQISGAVSNLTGSKSSLTGALSGSVGGAVNGAVSSAAGQVTGAINNAVPNIAGKANAALGQANAALGKATGALDKTKSALTALGAGGAAAQLSEAVGGLGGIQSALTAMGSVPSLTSLVDKAAGVSASAFDAVKKSFKSFKPNIPQNLTQIAKDNAAEAAAVADQVGQAGTKLLNAAGAASAVVKTPGSLGQAIKTASTVAGAIGSVSGAIGKVSSLAGAAGGLGGAVGSINNSISSISGELTNAKSALSKVSGLATAATTTLNNVTAVVNTVKKSPTGSVLNTTIGGIENAVNNVSAMAGAGATITAGGLPALSNAASVVQKGAQAATSSAMASGLSNLPGGINTVASVTNNAPGATNVVPGTANIKTAITNATTAVMNGLPSAASAAGALSSVAGALGNNKLAGTLSKVSGAIGTLNKLGGAADALKKGLPDLKGATSALGGAAGDIQGKLNGLTALASAGLPVGAIAELQSAISSLAGGVPGAIGLPAIGFNTTDRGAVTAQIGAVLGDPGIPAPNLVGEIPQETKSALDDKIAELKKKKAEINVKRKDLKAKRDAALKEFRKAEKSLPKGDPAIMAAYNVYSAAFDEWQKVDFEYLDADVKLSSEQLEKISPGSKARVDAMAQSQINTINSVFGTSITRKPTGSTGSSTGIGGTGS